MSKKTPNIFNKKTLADSWKALLATPPKPSEHNDSDYPNLESALAEIKCLKEDSYRRQCAILYVLTYHYLLPIKGRKPDPCLEIISSGNNRIKINVISPPLKKKHGRPAKSTLQKKKEILDEIDALKNEEGIKKNKALIELMVNSVFSHLSDHRRQRLIEGHLKEVKYFRDELRKKRKNPQ